MKNEEHKNMFYSAINGLAIAMQIKRDSKGLYVHKDLLNVYWQGLKDIPIEHLIKTIEYLSVTVRGAENFGKLPHIADIRDTARVLLRGTNSDRALKAWDNVLAAIDRVGTYRAVQFDDERTTASLHSIGGWAQLGRVQDKDLDWKKREFLKAYEAYISNPIPEEMKKHLPGTVRSAAITMISSDGTSRKNVKVLEENNTHDEELGKLISDTLSNMPWNEQKVG